MPYEVFVRPLEVAAVGQDANAEIAVDVTEMANAIAERTSLVGSTTCLEDARQIAGPSMQVQDAVGRLVDVAKAAEKT